MWDETAEGCAHGHTWKEWSCRSVDGTQWLLLLQNIGSRALGLQSLGPVGSAVVTLRLRESCSVAYGTETQQESARPWDFLGRLTEAVKRSWEPTASTGRRF